MFSTRNRIPLLDINDLGRLVTKTNNLVQLFKPKQIASSSLLSHSTQQQITQTKPSAIKFYTEDKVQNGPTIVTNRNQYQNICNPRNPSWFNNQTQNHTQF